MIAVVLYHQLQQLHSYFSPFQLISVYIISSVALFLVVHRIWKFTIRPLFHPHEPKELPYWIPYIGHTFAYVRSGHDVILRARYALNMASPYYHLLTVSVTVHISVTRVSPSLCSSRIARCTLFYTLTILPKFTGIPQPWYLTVLSNSYNAHSTYPRRP